MIQFKNQAQQLSYADVVELSKEYGYLVPNSNELYTVIKDLTVGVISNEIINKLLNLPNGTKGVFHLRNDLIVMLNVNNGTSHIITARKCSWDIYSITMRSISKG